MASQAIHPRGPLPPKTTQRPKRPASGKGAQPLVGQCGVEKSGNYLLYRTLRTAMERAGTFQSHAARTGCWNSLFALDGVPLSFPEQRDLDEAEVHDAQVYVRNSHLKARFALRDLARFERDAALLWTHQEPREDHARLLGPGRRWIYLIRDGRDVVNSWIHYATSPRMLARHPEYRIDTPEALYGRLDYFANSVDRWARHVEAYRALASRYELVRFEELVGDRAGQIARLLQFAGVEDRVLAADVLRHTEPERTRADAPNHVRRARVGDWQHFFGAEHERIYRERTGALVASLGLADYGTW